MAKLICYGFAVLVVFSGPTVSAQDATLKECRQLKDKIENYDRLRGEGGSGAQMDAWKRTRRELEKRFRNGGCRYYRWELR
ncbi:MAG: hypothetical protein V7720_13060 [Halioglobus sp.]